MKNASVRNFCGSASEDYPADVLAPRRRNCHARRRWPRIPRFLGRGRVAHGWLMSLACHTCPTLNRHRTASRVQTSDRARSSSIECGRRFRRVITAGGPQRRTPLDSSLHRVPREEAPLDPECPGHFGFSHMARGRAAGQCLHAEPGAQRRAVSLQGRTRHRDRHGSLGCAGANTGAVARRPQPERNRRHPEAAHRHDAARRHAARQDRGQDRGVCRSARQGSRIRSSSSHRATGKGPEGSGDDAAEGGERGVDEAPGGRAADACRRSGARIRASGLAIRAGSQVPRMPRRSGGGSSCFRRDGCAEIRDSGRPRGITCTSPSCRRRWRRRRGERASRSVSVRT